MDLTDIWIVSHPNETKNIFSLGTPGIFSKIKNQILANTKEWNNLPHPNRP